MAPDFSEENVVNQYVKNKDRENPIYVEEYEVDDSEGDKLLFAMARDEKGNVYIDNIYDPRVGITNYGTMKKIANMGYLVYKPEDYYTMSTIGFPKDCREESLSDQDYVNINLLWKRIPLIKKYVEELVKRNIMEKEDSPE